MSLIFSFDHKSREKVSCKKTDVRKSFGSLQPDYQGKEKSRSATSCITICRKEWIQPIYQLPPKEEWKMPLARVWHNERNTEKPYTAQFTRSKKFNSFRRLQSGINLLSLISLYHQLANKPNIFKIHLPPGRGHLLLWRPLHAHQIRRDQDSRHTCALQPAHPCGADECSGGVKGWQSPREQIGFLLNRDLALLCRHRLVRWCSLLQLRTWHNSSLSQRFPHLCSPLCDCCSSSGGLVNSNGWLWAWPDTPCWSMGRGLRERTVGASWSPEGLLTWLKTSKTTKGRSSASEHSVAKFGNCEQWGLTLTAHWRHVTAHQLQSPVVSFVVVRA